jgi:Translation elongation factor EF-1alpha (GTPase)
MECEVNILELPEHKPIMSSGYSCVMHIHAALEEVFIKEIMGRYIPILIFNVLAEYDKDNQLKTVKFFRSGSRGIVRIQTMNNPICCEKFEVMPQLGRFTLRDEGR